MYNSATGITTTGAGIAILPNTGGNPLLIALGIFSIVSGVIIIGSFLTAKIVGHYARTA